MQLSMRAIWREFGRNYYEKYFKIKSLYSFETRYLRKKRETGKLLDVGCGIGNYLLYVEKYYEAYGTDISLFAIQYAKKNLEKAILIISSANDLPFHDNSFDIATCFDVLEHMKDPQGVLKEIHRVLKQAGLLMVRVPNTASIGKNLKKANWYGFRDKTHISLLSNEEWIEFIERTGFSTVEVFYDGLWDTPYFDKIPGTIQSFLIKIPSVSLFQMGIRFPKTLGENLHVVAVKK